jgi:nucleotide-binding universal stress UspA family protein
MSFRNSLLVIRAYPAGISVAAVNSAVGMAATLGSRLSALACAIRPSVPRSVFGNTLLEISGIVSQEFEKSEEDAQRLLVAFEEAAKKAGIFGERLFRSCRPNQFPEILTACARLRDLTILPMVEGGYVDQFEAQWDAETIIFQSGHPSIVLPAEFTATPALDSVIIAWDESLAAARAIADAMPILKKARQIRILTVVGEKPIASKHPGLDLAQHLAFHAVESIVDEIDAAGRGIGDVLQHQVTLHRADLVVMGAYGHSRLREFILGGATKSMLRRPPTALFLSH